MPRPESETTKQTEPRSKPEALIGRLGALRDGLLLLAGILYLFGYISWAVYALTNRIGLVPVLDAQYFTAGIVPALIFLLFALSVRVLRAFQKWLKGPASKKNETVQKILFYVALAIMLVFGALKLAFRKSSPEWVSWMPFFVGAVFLLAAFLGRAKGDRFMQLMGLFLIWSYTILGALWLVLGYNIELFPRLPAELGGPRPRCAHLDLDRSQLSVETLRQLAGNPAAPADQPVLRSVPLYLIFDGSDYVFLAARSDSLSPTNPVYRIRKDAVKGVFPCDSQAIKSATP
jgi:hypothetical protein